LEDLAIEASYEGDVDGGNVVVGWDGINKLKGAVIPNPIKSVTAGV